MADIFMTQDDLKFINFIKSLSPFQARYPINWENWYTQFNIKLSEEVLELLQDKISWGWVSCCQILSEDFIRKFSDKVDFYYISKRKKLSEKFIKEFSHRLHYKYIPLCFFKINHEQSWQTFL